MLVTTSSTGGGSLYGSTLGNPSLVPAIFASAQRTALGTIPNGSRGFSAAAGGSDHLNEQLCTDKMKYFLLNTERGCNVQDTNTYFRLRRKLYRNLHTAVMDNKVSKTKADNLYIFAYSWFYTLRDMVSEAAVQRGVAVSNSHDDEALKKQFRGMITKLPRSFSAAHFQQEFLRVVFTQVPEAEQELFTQMNEFILGKTVGGGPMDEVRQQWFVDGSRDTDIFLLKKMEPDIHKFFPPHERLRLWLVKYQFAHGWATAAGIWVLGGVAPAVAFLTALFNK